MELYASLVSHQPKLLNPTIVIITDRRELDGQLFDTFNRSLLLPEKPKQIRRRSELRLSSLSPEHPSPSRTVTLVKFSVPTSTSTTSLVP
jgi:type I restriction enzyme R subunit